MHRPALNPENFDSFMLQIAPQLVTAFKLGDDGLLRFVFQMFEGQGFTVCCARVLLA